MDIDSAWDFNQPEVSEQRFRDMLAQASPPDDAEILTQIARAQGLQGQFEAAHRTLDDVQNRLTPTIYRVHVRYLLERGRVYNSSGDPAAAKPLFVQTWELANQHDEIVLAIDAAHMVAIVEQGDAVLEWNQKAVALAETSTIERARRWMGSLYNNIGWAYHDRGDYHAALAAFQKASDSRAEQGQRPQWRIAQWCIARTYRSLNRLGDALMILHALHDEHQQAGSQDGYVLEEIGECLLLTNRAHDAKPYFAGAYTLLSQDQWLVQHEPARLDRLRTLGDS